MKLADLKHALMLWQEEVATAGKKTALTAKDIKGLEMMISKVEEAQNELQELEALAGKYVEKAGW